MSQSELGFHLNQLRMLVTELGSVVGGVSLSDEQRKLLKLASATPDTADGRYTLAGVFSNINSLLMKAVDLETEEAKRILDEAMRTDKRTGVLARIAFGTTTSALTLICAFAIYSILGL